uniref:Uncharacterized protein n=1 Tax=Knipowitschia caucasica TaxID=637954 RepID=A0AAV2J1L3_KNICA
MLAIAGMFQSDRPVTYCRFNTDVPVLRLWLDVELETRQDFRLSRQAMHSLQRLMKREQNHGWGNEYEVLVYVYWLAHGLSYRVVSRVFSIPKSTIHRIVHRVAQLFWDNLNRAISFPKPADIDTVAFFFLFLGDGFGVVDRVVDGVAGMMEEAVVDGVVGLVEEVVVGVGGLFEEAVVGLTGGVVGGLVEEAGAD